MGRHSKQRPRKKSSPKPKKADGKKKGHPPTLSSSWVDHISFRPVLQNGTTNNNNKHTNNNIDDTTTTAATQHTNEFQLSVSIICWNMLAEGYCSPRSHPGLPRQYQEVVFDKTRRGSLIRKILCSGKAKTVNTETGFLLLEEATQAQLFGDDDDDDDDDDDGQNSNGDRDAMPPPLATPSLQLLPDIWALQEVDMDEVLSKHLSSMGYEGVETPRMKIGAGAGGKADACGIYFRSEKWKLLDQELIRLDDLASLTVNDGDENDDDNKNGGATINNNLQGLQRSFLRRNVALLVRLQSQQSPETTLVLAVTHLFWNPVYEYVKLCQMHYIMVRAKKFRRSESEPFVMCGDLNSLAGSSVHEYLTKGRVNAKLVAPWYREGTTTTVGDRNENEPVFRLESHTEESKDAKEGSLDGLGKEMASLSVSSTIADSGNVGSVIKTQKVSSLQHSKQQVRYLLDVNLNRLCRWFRILGLDAGLETEAEERLRTKKSKIKLFDRCRDERRVLITTSSTLLARTNCPAGTYLVNPKCLQGNWEIILAHILLTHGVVLDPNTFLTRCVVCNGNICSVNDPELKKKLFAEHQAPVDDDDGLAVFQCDGCKQGYWWCDRPTSSASRVKCQATRLYQMCLQAHVPINPSTKQHIFSHLDAEKEMRRGWDWTMKGSGLLKLKLQVTEWLRDPNLTCPIVNLESAYKDDSNDSGESIPFSNMTRDFEGLLDYIFFDGSFTLSHNLYVPTTHEELNTSNMSNGYLLPSNVWPSDHLAIGATLVVRPD